jgi:hypothetical protein
MSDHGAYEDEMRLRRPYDSDDAGFSSLAEEIRSACLGAPGPEVQARHLQAIFEQARRVPEVPVAEDAAVAPFISDRKRAKPLGVLARLGAAAAGLALLTGSLALAGVDLPVLPDMASGNSEDAAGEGGAGGGEDQRSETAARVQAAIQSGLPRLQAGEISGCEFGAMVSAAARGLEPDTSHCTADDNNAGDSDSPRSETAQRVHAALDENLPLLRAGDISGCEFGAIVSAAARGVAPDTSRCEASNVKARAEQGSSRGTGSKGTAGQKSTPAKGSEAAGKSQVNGKGAGADATGGPEEPAEKSENQDKGEAKPKQKDVDESPGQGKGKGAPPAGKPGGKSNGD